MIVEENGVLYWFADYPVVKNMKRAKGAKEFMEGAVSEEETLMR
jgi:hypothetical protein